MDARLEYNRNPVYAYLGYGSTWTQYQSTQDNFTLWFDEPIQSYHPFHDRRHQRHQVNGMISLNIGAFTTSLNWQFGTGLPYTCHMGFDEFINLQSLPDIRRRYGTPRIILDRPYRGRLPAFHRLDFSVERTFNLPGADLNLTAGAINAYDRANLFYYDIYTQQRIDQLPLLPYISLKIETKWGILLIHIAQGYWYRFSVFFSLFRAVIIPSTHYRKTIGTIFQFMDISMHRKTRTGCA